MNFLDKDRFIIALQNDINELKVRLEKIQYISATIIFALLLIVADLFFGAKF